MCQYLRQTVLKEEENKTGEGFITGRRDLMLMNAKAVIRFAGKFVVLLFLFALVFTAGSVAVEGHLPDAETEPGLVPPGAGILIISAISTLLIMAVITTSRYSGWRLMAVLAVSYYGVATFMTQIETWYFLAGVTVDEALLLPLFLMGLPVALFFIPLAVLILGKGRAAEPVSILPGQVLIKEWVWRLAAIALIYLVIYWLAGYFIAWQNPELRAFYGSPGEAVPFFAHTLATLRDDPGLFPFQILRGLLFSGFALPVIFGSKLEKWGTAVLTGLFLSLPISVVQIIENPLIPQAGVRFSHMIETLISTFIFGVIAALLLQGLLSIGESTSVKGSKGNAGQGYLLL